LRKEKLHPMQDETTTEQMKYYGEYMPQVVTGKEALFDFGLDKNQEERASIIHNNSLTVSFHEHAIVFPSPREKYIDEYLSSGRPMIAYEGLEASGLCTVFSGVDYGKVFQRRPCSLPDLVWNLGMHHTDTTRQKDGKFFVGKWSQDIARAKKEGKIAIIPTYEYGGVIGNQLDNLDVLYGLGLRCLALTYFHQNLLGGGELDPGAHLTDFGIDAVHRMNDLGMMVDVCHTNKFTTLEAIEVSERPCVVSHSLASAVNGFSNFKSDEEIKALAEKSGIFGVKVGSDQLKKHENTTINDALDHMDYVAKLVGVDCVAIGPDTTWEYPHHVQGYRNPSQFINILRGLVSREYSDAEIKKIAGENVVRAMAQIEK